MSYRVGTTNFNLPQTEGTDKRDWSDTNQAFADVDAALGQAGTDASQALTLATTAQTTADGAVTTAQGAVTTANAASATAQSASEAAALARTEAQSASTVAGQANTTAQAAQTTASNADTVALAAQTNIGTMANLQTTDKTSLVAAINEVLSQIGGGGMPTLDFANPLHTFSSGNLTFTATKECYLVGELYGIGSTRNTASINNTLILAGMNSSSSGFYCGSIFTKLSAGDVVTLTDACDTLHVFDVAS